MKNATQLKALIRNCSKERSISAQILLRNYMHERFLERVSLSRYRNNFILKGGQLISILVGLDIRSTMDMDATIKGVPLSRNHIMDIFHEILSVKVSDNVKMDFHGIDEIRDELDNNGYRLSINTSFDGIF